MLDRLLAAFGDAAVYDEVERAFDAGEIRLVDDIERKLATVDAPLDELVEWLHAHARVRPGWPELVRQARAWGDRVAVVTSSFEELVAPLLGDTIGEVELVANRLVRGPDGWEASFASEEVCSACGEPCKRALVAALGAAEVVYVGDGYSDRCAAEVAQRVFARDGLARHLERQSVAYEPWEDFHDIAAALRREQAVSMTSSVALRTPWWQTRHGGESGFLVAYFSMEFGLSERLPVYSGGLGVLAGDHLKAASDLGVPLVGVGLLYRLGYFRQSLDGGQQERWETLDPAAAGLVLERGPGGTPVTVAVDLDGEEVRAQIWRADVGDVPLFLLDTAVEGNSEAGRSVTDVLYGGDREHRLRQELVLGVGGPRALAALGLGPSVYHVNEGHAAFLAIERLRTAVEEQGAGRDEALGQIRASTVFTTHTPGAGRQRALRPGARAPVRRPAGRARGALMGGAGGARPGPGRGLVRPHPPRPAHLGRRQRRLRAARRGRPGHVARARGRGPDRRDHERRPLRLLDQPADRRGARGGGRRPPGATRRAGLGLGSRRRPRRARGCTALAEAEAAGANRRTRVLPRRADDRVRTPLRHLQARRAALLGRRATARDCCTTPIGRCSWSWPARRTRPTRAGRS